MVLLVALVLTACASAPKEAASRYVLSAVAASEPPEGEGTRVLRIAPIQLARYLDVENLIMQTSDVSIQSARNHLWAEDLGVQLRRALQRELGRRLDGVRVIGGEAADPKTATNTLQVSVDSFQGRYDGVAVVSGQWRLIDGDGNTRMARNFRVERELDSDGYPALVKSLDEAWRTVAARIAADMPEGE